MFDLSNMVVTKVCSVNRLTASPTGTLISRQNRERWAIALKYQGRTVYRSGGQEFLSDGLHPVLLPQGSDYAWECIKPGLCYIIEFESPAHHDLPLSFSIPENNTLLKNIHRIEQAKGQAERLRCLYDCLLFLLSSAESRYTPSRTQAMLQPALAYMTGHYADPHITNDSLAALCGISTVYFRKAFSAAYHLSPIRYLQNLRIEKAKSLLQSDYGTIAQVAESVGFSSIYHFSKMFRQAVGVSPRSYAAGKKDFIFREDYAKIKNNH